MRIRLVASSLVALAAVACFTPVGEPDYWSRVRRNADGGVLLSHDGGAGVSCLPVECKQHGTVNNAESVVLILSSLPWTSIARRTSACLEASADVPVERTVSIAASDVVLPQQCWQGTCANLTFQIAPAVSGVKCLDQFCSALMLSGARFRVRQTLRDQYPMNPRYVPVVEFLPPCGTPCGATELTCQNHHTCWASELDLCRFCEGRPHEECACLGKAEGAGCLLYKTNDLTCRGTCAEGECRPEEPACW